MKDQGEWTVLSDRRTILPLLALALFAVLLALGRTHDTFPGDGWALLELRGLRTGWLDHAAMFLSTVGQGGIGWGAAVPWIPVGTVVVVLAAKRRGEAVFLAAAVLAPVINLGLKELVARPRPDADLWLVQETGYGFPSGHAVFAVAFLGAMAWLVSGWSLLDERPVLRSAVRAALLLLALAVGFSRVYLGVHWPSDVIAGFLFGGLYLAALVALRRIIEIRRRSSGKQRKY